jgi:hypothetical protein
MTVYIYIYYLNSTQYNGLFETVMGLEWGRDPIYIYIYIYIV